MIKDEEGNDVVDQETTNRLVDYALEHGVNYFDTAPVYLQGQSEKATGIALKRHPRESYFIATKLSNFSNASRENTLEMYYKSFENLQTDYIDYYLLHSISGMGAFQHRYVDNGVIDFLLEERKAGRIRNLGFSFHGSAEGFDELMATHEKYHWDFVQIQLNYVDWKHAGGRNANAEYLQQELDKRNIPSIIMEPLLGGRLSKVPDNIAERLKERNPQGSVASWAFRFAGTPAGVLCVLSGMTYMEHLQDNLKTYSPLAALNEKELEFLEETVVLMQDYPTIPCNDCKYCMPCPYGIDIPAILLHYNKCVNAGEIATSSTDSNYSKARRAYLVSYDRAVPKLRQAARCIACGECMAHCPQSIDIPKEIRRIDKYIEDLKTDTLGI
jgi:predicted aldo/keto reductase-like oxidoreductase